MTTSPLLDDSFIMVGPDARNSPPISPLRPSTLSNTSSDASATHGNPDKHDSLNASYTPGSAGSYAHNWSPSATGGGIRIEGRHFVDAYGRVVNLRGVNLSGSSKTPVNHDNDTFPDGHETVTFVGRPFPLEEAHEHFSRLRRWGLTFIRFLVTWEAVEHEGPGKYDTAYLAYLRALLALLPAYGLVAFVSLHQDVWSRYAGGSGAPAWTLEAAGFDLLKLEECHAAWLKGVKGGGHNKVERGIWPCGYQKLAAATMATCFWAGDTFAPKLRVKDAAGAEVPIQRFLQSAFLDMWARVAETVRGLPGVIGFEMLNEPHRGYIEQRSLHEFVYETDLHLDYVPSALQSFLLGAGHPTRVAHWTRSFPMPTRRTGSAVLNAGGASCWRPDGPTAGQCLWEMHGVWGWDVKKAEGVVLREGYFVKHPTTGAKIDWHTDFFYPFVRKWADRVRAAGGPEKIVFLESIPNEFCPESWTASERPSNLVFAPHWYDLNALFSKAFGEVSVNVQGLSRGMSWLNVFYWGQRGARENYALQLRTIVEMAYAVLGETPVIIGECGIPMDMNEREAFKTDEWQWQARMMDALLYALEGAMIGFTLWNYNPDNDDTNGDSWNGENFSWFSRSRALPASLLDFDQTAHTLDHGGRVLRSVVRPYAAKVAGIPLRAEYESATGRFYFVWTESDAAPAAKPTAKDETPSDKVAVTAAPSRLPTVTRPPRTLPAARSRETEIFLPAQLTQGREVRVRGLDPARGEHWVHDPARQTLFIVVSDPPAPSSAAAAAAAVSGGSGGAFIDGNQEEMGGWKLRDVQARAGKGRVHTVEIAVLPVPESAFEVHGFWDDFGGRILALIALILGIVAYWAVA